MAPPSVSVVASASAEMYDVTARQAIDGGGGAFFFDGNVGVYGQDIDGTVYAFGQLGGTAATKIVSLSGPINDFAQTHNLLTVSGVPGGIGYCSGGCFVGVGSGKHAIVAHRERYTDTGQVWSSFGILRTSDGGATWEDLGGDSLTMEQAFDNTSTVALDIQNGPLVISPDGLYYYQPFAEALDFVQNQFYSMARYLITDFNAAVVAGTMPPVEKWQSAGVWSSSLPGVNLPSLPVPSGSFPDMWKDSGLGIYIRSATHAITSADAYVNLLFSYDCEEWSDPVRVTLDENPGGVGIIYSNLIPETFTGTREGTGTWTVAYMDGNFVAGATVRYVAVTLTLETPPVDVFSGRVALSGVVTVQA